MTFLHSVCLDSPVSGDLVTAAIAPVAADSLASAASAAVATDSSAPAAIASLATDSLATAAPTSFPIALAVCGVVLLIILAFLGGVAESARAQTHYYSESQ